MRKTSISFLVVLLCVSWFMAFPCKAAIVWSDDFNDGNYDGWTVLNGTFVVEDGMLKDGPGDYDLIVHESSVAFGTWSFDITIPNWVGMPGGIILIGSYPISSSFTTPQQGLRIRTTSNLGGFVPARIQNYTEINIGAFFGVPSTASGIARQHVDVTRSLQGQICFYINGTLIADTVDTSVTTTSEFFGIYSQTAYQVIIDNVAVSDTVDIQPPSNVPFYMETWFLATIGAAVVVVAIVIIAVVIRRR